MKFLSNLYSFDRGSPNQRIIHLDNLVGNFIVANPNSDAKDYFSKTIILIISHDEKDSIGLIINKGINNISSHLLFKSLGVECDLAKDYGTVYLGGPVDNERGLILHSIDYNKNSIIIPGLDIAFSSNIEIIKAIANNKGPRFSKMFLGYTSWSQGQLEEEIMNDNWLTLPYSKDLFFSSDSYNQYELALSKIGVKKAFFSEGNDLVN
jgi:putative transcriptional regulator